MIWQELQWLHVCRGRLKKATDHWKLWVLYIVQKPEENLVLGELDDAFTAALYPLNQLFIWCQRYFEESSKQTTVIFHSRGNSCGNMIHIITVLNKSWTASNHSFLICCRPLTIPTSRKNNLLLYSPTTTFPRQCRAELQPKNQANIKENMERLSIPRKDGQNCNQRVILPWRKSRQ